MLYNYRCQICGRSIGEKYDSYVVEAHHIDYFVHSLNNDSNNQLIEVLTPIIKSVVETVDNFTTKTIAGTLRLAVFYFIGNSITALICMLTGKITKGVLPVVIIILNGVIIGFALMLTRQVLTPWQFLLCLAPHGIFELTALFWACSIGMLSLAMIEKLKLFVYPLLLMMTAGFMEAFASPIVLRLF